MLAEPSGVGRGAAAPPLLTPGYATGCTSLLPPKTHHIGLVHFVAYVLQNIQADHAYLVVEGCLQKVHALVVECCMQKVQAKKRQLLPSNKKNRVKIFTSQLELLIFEM